MAFGDIWTKWMEFTFNFYSSNRKQFETRITQERWNIIFEFFPPLLPLPPQKAHSYIVKISMVQKMYKMEMSNIVSLNIYDKSFPFFHIQMVTMIVRSFISSRWRGADVESAEGLSRRWSYKLLSWIQFLTYSTSILNTISIIFSNQPILLQTFNFYTDLIFATIGLVLYME